MAGFTGPCWGIDKREPEPRVGPLIPLEDAASPATAGDDVEEEEGAATEAGSEDSFRRWLMGRFASTGEGVCAMASATEAVTPDPRTDEERVEAARKRVAELERLRPRKRRYWTSAQKNKCWACHATGHRYWQCPNPTIATYCLGCGNAGYTRQTCPRCRERDGVRERRLRE